MAAAWDRKRVAGRQEVLMAASALSLYLTAYLALHQPQVSAIGTMGRLIYERHPSYRLGGHTACRLFTPALWLDQRIRPAYWDWSIPMFTSSLDILLTPGKPPPR